MVAASISLGCGAFAGCATGGSAVAQRCVSAEATIARMTSGSFGPDYVGCRVPLAVRFAGVMPMRVHSCDDGTVIAVFDDAPGHIEAQSSLPVCVPKARAAIVFELHEGDPLTLTAGSWRMLRMGDAWGLWAEGIERRDR